MSRKKCVNIGCEYLISPQSNNVHDPLPSMPRPLPTGYLADNPGQKENDGKARAVMDCGTAGSARFDMGSPYDNARIADARVVVKGSCIHDLSDLFRPKGGSVPVSASYSATVDCSVRREQIPPQPQPLTYCATACEMSQTKLEENASPLANGWNMQIYKASAWSRPTTAHPLFWSFHLQRTGASQFLFFLLTPLSFATTWPVRVLLSHPNFRPIPKPYPILLSSRR